MIDYNNYYIMGDTDLHNIMEVVSMAQAMADKSFPHLSADIKRKTELFRKNLEVFQGSQYKPKTKKAYGSKQIHG